MIGKNDDDERPNRRVSSCVFFFFVFFLSNRQDWNYEYAVSENAVKKEWELNNKQDAIVLVIINLSLVSGWTKYVN